MSERPQNVRFPRTVERSATGGHNSRRHTIDGAARATEHRAVESHAADERSYRGSHRAGGRHHADDRTAGGHRESRVGRHHADPAADAGHW